MDLSPYERHLLDDIESRTKLEDPRLAAMLARGRPRRLTWPLLSVRRVLVSAAVALLVGIGLVVAGVVMRESGVAFAGLALAIIVPVAAGVLVGVRRRERRGARRLQPGQ